MDINNHTENACTRNASKVHGKTLCWACVGSAGLNAYTEPPGFRQFISFSRKIKGNLVIPHILVLYYDKANQSIANDV